MDSLQTPNDTFPWPPLLRGWNWILHFFQWSIKSGKKKTVRKVGQKEVQRHQLPICSTESSSKKMPTLPKRRTGDWRWKAFQTLQRPSHWLTSTPKKHMFGVVYCFKISDNLSLASIQRLREGFLWLQSLSNGPNVKQINHQFYFLGGFWKSQAKNDVASNKSPRVQPGDRMLKRCIKSWFFRQISRWDHASLMDRFSQKKILRWFQNVSCLCV